MKVYMYFCNRCGDFFKSGKVCPTCLGRDMLMGPYLVDEIEFDVYYQKQHVKRSK